MSFASLTHRLNAAQRLWDHGVSVTINKMEYIQADKLYLRAEVLKDSLVVDVRPIEYPSSKLALMNLVSGMSEEEYVGIISTLALNDFKSRKPIPDLLFDAIQIHKSLCDKICYINEYNTAEGSTVKLDKPVSIVITPSSGELPFQLALPQIYEKGANIAEFDTIYQFKQARQSDPQLPKGSYIYGSSHDVFGKVTQPALTIKDAQKQNLEHSLS